MWKLQDIKNGTWDKPVRKTEGESKKEYVSSKDSDTTKKKKGFKKSTKAKNAK